jgi:hypothetical protein
MAGQLGFALITRSRRYYCDQTLFYMTANTTNNDFTTLIALTENRKCAEEVEEEENN